MAKTRALSVSLVLSFAAGFVGCGDGATDDDSCQPGSYFCACLGGQCMVGLTCIGNLCLGDDATNPETSGNSGDGDGTPGDGDGTPGDGDGTPGDGDGTPGDGDGTPGDGDGDGDVCDFPLARTPANVMFVVDASAGMVLNTVDHDLNANTPAITRWNMVISGLQTVLPGYQATLRTGIKRFPSSTAMAGYSAEGCTTTTTVESGVALNNVATMLAAVPPAGADNTQIKGASPTSRGFAAAVTHISTQTATVPRAIVLIADSIGACNPNDAFPALFENLDTTLLPAVGDALLGDEITTHAFGIQLPNQVVGAGAEGSPEGNPHVWLNDIAIAGGAPLSGSTKYRDASTQAGLNNGLATVLDSLVCTVDLNSLPVGAPSQAEIPNVGFQLNGAAIPMLGDCAAGSGWMWVIPGDRVRFCGSTCSSFKAAVGGFTGNYCG